MDFEIKLASTQQEKEEVYRFRYRIYIEEQKKFHIAADHSQKMMYDEIDEWALVYYGTAKGEIVSTVRSIRGIENDLPENELNYFELNKLLPEIPQSKIAVVNRLAVAKNYRGTAVTAQCFYSTYKDGSLLGIQLCFVTCDDFLLPIYLHYGFRVYGEPVTLAGNKRRYRLVLFVTDYAHLKKVSSPFLKFFNGLEDDHGEYAAKVKQLLGYDLHTPKLTFKQQAVGMAIKCRRKLVTLF